MPKIFLIKNRLHQQQQRLLESQNLLQDKNEDHRLVPPLSPSPPVGGGGKPNSPPVPTDVSPRSYTPTLRNAYSVNRPLRTPTPTQTPSQSPPALVPAPLQPPKTPEPQGSDLSPSQLVSPAKTPSHCTSPVATVPGEDLNEPVNLLVTPKTAASTTTANTTTTPNTPPLSRKRFHHRRYYFGQQQQQQKQLYNDENDADAAEGGATQSSEASTIKSIPRIYAKTKVNAEARSQAAANEGDEDNSGGDWELAVDG
ncbi:uncharacterized protein LOC129238199 [Anastrepha obliqua]|uniref:uncharacterized protein LOC129238199 n=1 Tax=Anastrepha obliqua TaxID=95512 RepID=UPI002408F9BC|nr:uncharacterized protein LOC129238199 [Anastrepha obliqua]